MADLVDPKTLSDDTFHPVDALGQATRTAMLAGTAGVFLAAVKNTRTKENVGAFGVITRFGGTIGLFGMSWKRERTGGVRSAD
jgi:hypothetical protein